jgi:hypothetical protein
VKESLNVQRVQRDNHSALPKLCKLQISKYFILQTSKYFILHISKSYNSLDPPNPHQWINNHTNLYQVRHEHQAWQRNLRACKLCAPSTRVPAEKPRVHAGRTIFARAPSSKRNEEMMLAPTVEPGKYVVRWDGDIDIVCQCCCLSKSGLNSQPR